MQTVTLNPIDLLEEIDLNPVDEAVEISQNVAAIIATPQGSVPLEREIGMQMEYLDLPAALSVRQYDAELTEALDQFEPRAEMDNVEADDVSDGALSMGVKVRLYG